MSLPPRNEQNKVQTLREMIPSLSPHEAEEYLRRNNYDIERALAVFFEAQQQERQRQFDSGSSTSGGEQIMFPTFLWDSENHQQSQGSNAAHPTPALTTAPTAVMMDTAAPSSTAASRSLLLPSGESLLRQTPPLPMLTYEPTLPLVPYGPQPKDAIDSDLQRAITLSLQDQTQAKQPDLHPNLVDSSEAELSRAIEQSLLDNNSGGGSGSSSSNHGSSASASASQQVQLRPEGYPAGLRNVGNTCYFNSIISMFFSLPAFRERILSVDVEAQQMEVQRKMLQLIQSPAAAEGSQTVLESLKTRNYSLIFLRELQVLFAHLAISRQKAVDPSKVLSSFVDNTGAVIPVGPQQDVGEFAQLFLNRLEEALAPFDSQASSSQTNVIKQLFYATTINFTVSFEENGSLVSLSNASDCDSVILAVSNLYSLNDALDAFTEPTTVDNLRTPKNFMTKGENETWFRRLPPVLTFHLKRVTYNVASQAPEKSNHRIDFPLFLDMDRYMESKKETSLELRRMIKKLRAELSALKAELNTYLNFQNEGVPLEHLIRATGDYLTHKKEQTAPYPQCDTPQENEAAQQLLLKYLTEVRTRTAALHQRISAIELDIVRAYESRGLTQERYRLHAVFVHRGQAMYGHYWAFIFDPARSQWWRHNDSTVERVSFETVYSEAVGGDMRNETPSAYCLVYVKQDWFPEVASGNVDANGCEVALSKSRLESLVSASLWNRIRIETEAFEAKTRSDNAGGTAPLQPMQASYASRPLPSSPILDTPLEQLTPNPNAALYASVQSAVAGSRSESMDESSLSSLSSSPPANPLSSDAAAAAAAAAGGAKCDDSLSVKRVHSEVVEVEKNLEAVTISSPPHPESPRKSAKIWAEGEQGADASASTLAPSAAAASEPSEPSVTSPAFENFQKVFAIDFNNTQLASKNNANGSPNDARLYDRAIYFFQKAPAFVTRHWIARQIVLDKFCPKAALASTEPRDPIPLSESLLRSIDDRMPASSPSHLVLTREELSTVNMWHNHYDLFLRAAAFYVGAMECYNANKLEEAVDWLYFAAVSNQELMSKNAGFLPERCYSQVLLRVLGDLVIDGLKRIGGSNKTTLLHRTLRVYVVILLLRAVCAGLKDELDALMAKHKSQWLTTIDTLIMEDDDPAMAQLVTILSGDTNIDMSLSPAEPDCSLIRTNIVTRFSELKVPELM